MLKSITILFVCSFLVFAGYSACSSENGTSQTMTLFAAASLTNALPAAIKALKDSLTNLHITYNFASSSILARQIMAGSPADIIFSANPDWVEKLIQKGLIERKETVEFLSNTLVVVVPTSFSFSIRKLKNLVNPNIRFIAIGDPSHVPAGKYAKEALQAAGIWSAVENKFVFGYDVRSALSFVESGDADAGIVYLSDARVSQRVKLAFRLPLVLQPRIRYVIAPIKNAPQAAKQLICWLQLPGAGRIFEKYGFIFLQADTLTHKLR